MFIPDPDPDYLPIPDPGVKKAQDPGSGSATLVFLVDKSSGLAEVLYLITGLLDPSTAHHSRGFIINVWINLPLLLSDKFCIFLPDREFIDK